VAKRADSELRTTGWGIDLNYKDALGNWHRAPDQTVSAIFSAIGADSSTLAPPPDDSVIVVSTGDQHELPAGGTIILETGETLSADSRLPPDLPAGYHQLQLDGRDAPARLIVSPGKCWLPEDLKTWGWAVQLYGARSRESWGIGDLGDLELLSRWSAKGLGAGMMMLNPLSAPSPVTPQQPSPYYPASRRFFNPLWLRIEWIPGATTENVPHLERLARAARELNRRRMIDRDKVFALKMEALESLWLLFPGGEKFDRYCREHALDLDRFATFCALAEHYKSGWHGWPEEYRHPGNSSVAEFVRENRQRVLFHKWLQWLLDVQLERCSKEIALVQDLPIGVDPDGADAWAWQDVFANGISVGAPPDEFNTQGQNWGFPPFVPHKLRAARYEPFIQTIRAAFRHGGGLRIDHVMGLLRLFWIPADASASDGAYVRYNADEMLAILALESQRAKAYVVGEDLGTVEPDVHDKLARHSLLSYRLLWFEKNPPDTYPRDTLAAVTTHDLPTVAGLWTGSDLKKQRKLRLKPNEESTAEIRSRLISTANLSRDAKPAEAILAAYRLLAGAPSRIVTAALDDAAGAEERPNMPATTEDQNPNWSLALPLPIEDLMRSDLPKRIAAELQREH
jgi:4-alpha-glucanotransferase